MGGVISYKGTRTLDTGSTAEGPVEVSRDNGLPVAPIGCTATASFTPAASAYGAGDLISVAQEFAFTYANGQAIPSGSLIQILSTTLKIATTGLTSTEGAYTLPLYTVTPPSAQADNDLWTVAAGDLAAYTMKALALGTPVDLGAAIGIRTDYTDTRIKLATSSLWAPLVTTPGFTATAVARELVIHAVVL